MKEDTIERLLSLNFQFYQTFAEPFSATRQNIQPGVKRILQEISIDQKILDIGCGNGNVWHALMRQNHRGAYVGLDFSPEILRQAVLASHEVRQMQAGSTQPIFLLVDLSEEKWEISVPGAPFDNILIFAVLHHVPGMENRKRIIQQVRHLLAPQGKIVVSVWQFLNSARLRARIQDWSKIHLDDHDIDSNDYLLDWRSGGTGFRYAHHFNSDELEELATENQLRVIQSFLSDGEGGNLGLYQIWEEEK